MPRNRQRRSVIAVAAAGALAMTVVACGTEEDTGAASKEITVAVSDSPSATALKAVAAEFEKQTGIKVTFADLPYDQLATKVLLASKKPSSSYDVVQFDSPMLASLAQGGALADIGTQVNDSASYDNSDFPKPVQEYAKYQDKTYSIPLSTEPYILWYRTDLFDELNLKPPKTWDEYLANAKALKEAGYDGSDSGFGSKIGAYYWLEAIYSSGGSLLKPDTCTPALDSTESKAATKAYLDALPFTPATAVNGGGNEMTTAFVQSDVGQMINATGYYSIMNDPKQSKIQGKFDAALPPGLSGESQTLLFGWLIGVGAQSDAQSEAWKFLEFALGKDATRTLIDAGAPPTGRTSLVSDKSLAETLPYLPTLVEAAAVGTHLPYTPEMPEIITALSAALSQAAADNQSADQLIEAGTLELQKILKGKTNCG